MHERRRNAIGGDARRLAVACLAVMGLEGVRAQPVVAPRPQDQAVAPPAEPRPPTVLPAAGAEIVGPDGKPLSAERQREIRERLKDDPVLAAPPAAAAPPATEPPPPERRPGAVAADPDEVAVTGRRPRGSVVGDIPPAQTFTPLDVRAYGADDLGELIESLGAQVASGRGGGDPVVLLNGRRVSSFLEIARIPAEAIERVEVFPEELALKYGYSADQKVVNVITYPRFAARVAQLGYARPTEGGRDTPSAGLNYLRLAGDARINLDAAYDASGALLESERGVRQLPGAADLGRFRTLLPASRRIALSGVVGAPLFGDVSGTLNARFEDTTNDSLLGRGPAGTLKRDLDTTNTHVGAAVNGRIGRWTWSAIGNYDRLSTEARTDLPGVTGGREEARSANTLIDGSLLMSGPVLALPAGTLAGSVQAGGDLRDFDGRSVRDGDARRTVLARDRAVLRVNLDLPLTSRTRGGARWLGALSVNLNATVETLSDRGTLRTIGSGANWSPLRRVNVIASLTREGRAPTVEQLGAPLIATPDVRTFDAVRREVVDVTRLFGGTPGLAAEDRRVVKLGINARPAVRRDLVVSMDYFRTRIDRPIAAFPIATPAVEAAFPDRFARDATGRLLQIDGRPLNFDRSDQENVRWGFTYVRPLGAVPEGLESSNAVFVGSERDLQGALPPGARIVQPEPGSAAMRQFENAASRLILSAYYTLTTRDEIVTRSGSPVLDLLDGFATGNRGGSPRHRFDVQLGAYQRGLGARLAASWQSGTSVLGLSESEGSGSADLDFAGFGTVNLALFANLADRFGGAAAPGWLRGARITAGVTNLFNARPRIRDASGATPVAFQPAYVDPIGRIVSLGLRKLF